jgi:hypothetical protein
MARTENRNAKRVLIAKLKVKRPFCKPRLVAKVILNGPQRNSVGGGGLDLSSLEQG